MNIEKIKQLVEDGFAVRRISKLLKHNEQELRKVIQNNNFILKIEVFTENTIPYIIELYKLGVSAKTLGQKYKIDKRRVQGWAKESNILRSKNDTHRFNVVNEHIFDNINTIESAYWLGFIYADAYHNENLFMLNIGLKRDDRVHLEKYCKFIGSELDIVKDYESKINDKIYQCSRVKIYSEILSSKLLELGCMQAKSFKIKFPNFLQKDFVVHFIRGYFDGDGSIKKHNNMSEWRAHFCSTKEMLEPIKNMIENELNISSSLIYWSKTNNNTYLLEFSGNQQILNFCEWLYKDSMPATRLDRKYDRYLALKEQQSARTFKKKSYRILPNEIEVIKAELLSGKQYNEIAKDRGYHPRTITKIKSIL